VLHTSTIEKNHLNVFIPYLPIDRPFRLQRDFARPLVRRARGARGRRRNEPKVHLSTPAQSALQAVIVADAEIYVPPSRISRYCGSLLIALDQSRLTEPLDVPSVQNETPLQLTTALDEVPPWHMFGSKPQVVWHRLGEQPISELPHGFATKQGLPTRHDVPSEDRLDAPHSPSVEVMPNVEQAPNIEHVFSPEFRDMVVASGRFEHVPRVEQPYGVAGPIRLVLG
jgi:hypothetical protein